MQTFWDQIHPDYFIYAGAIGVGLGFLFLFIFLYRRGVWLLRRIYRKQTKELKLLASLRNLLTIFLWTSIFGLLFFLGFFLRAYQVFTYQQPIAQIRVQPLDQPLTNRIILTRLTPPDSLSISQYVIRGDQWMLEGDILKWDDWLNFLGLHTRFRLTRIRGRYLHTRDEIRQPATIYSLVEDEDHPLWGYLYRHGHRLPFLDSVYGNTVFQNAEKEKLFQIYVTTSGFSAKEIDEAAHP